MSSPLQTLIRGIGLLFVTVILLAGNPLPAAAEPTDTTASTSGVRDIGLHIGLEATDGRDYSTPLEAGMVFTVEPKLYAPELDVAIMIEDMILVTPDGHENLSARAPKAVEDIERIMGGR